MRMEDKIKVDVKGLTEFLKTLTKDDFRNGIGIEKSDCTEREYHEYWKTVTDIDPNNIIKNLEPFLVDAVGNDISVVYATKRPYKIETNNGMKTKRCKLLKTIIPDCREQYGTPLNGYWVIPERFLTRS